MRLKLRLSVAIGMVVALSTAASPAFAASPSRGVDISATVEGRAFAADAAGRYARSGVQVEPQSLVVLRHSDGSMTIAPKSVILTDTWNDDRGTGARILVSPRDERLAATPGARTSRVGANVYLIASAPYWLQQGHNCFSRYSRTGGVDGRLLADRHARERV